MTKTERPRLVKRHVATGEVAQSALAVARADRAGVVDGVEVDFRHPDLPEGQWEARPWWYVADDTGSHAGFLFPSEKIACEKVANQDEDARHKLKLPFALAGDRITIEAVVPRITGGEFDHPHDATIRDAYLVLTRTTGEQVRPSGPMSFYGVTQLRDGPSYDAFDRLAERIQADHGHPDPHKHELAIRLRPLGGRWRSDRELSLSQRAGLFLEGAERAWHKLASGHLADDPQGQTLLRCALNEAVLAAFFQAKHELRQAEKIGSATRRNLAKGPKASRDQAAIDFALKAWAKDPNRTRRNIAKEISIERHGHVDDNTVRSLMRTLGPHEPKR